MTKKPRRAFRLAPSLGPRMAVTALVMVAISAYVMSTIHDVELSEIAPYFLIAIAIQFLPFLIRSTPDPFEPVSLTSVMTLLAIVPALTSFMATDSVQILLLPHLSGRSRIDLLRNVMVAYSLGSLAYYVGYYQTAGRKLAFLFPNVAGGTWRRQRLILVCVVCLGIFLPAYAYFQARVGTSLTNVTDLSAGKTVMREESSNATWIARAVGIGSIPPLLLLSLAFPNFRWRRGIATFGLLFLVGFLATRLGSRGTAIYWVINALIIIHYLWRRIPMSVLVPLAFAVLVMINLLGRYRNPDAVAVQGPTANFNVSQTLIEHDDDRMRVAATAVVFDYFPAQKDHLMGESWGPALTLFIPRWLWPDKHLLFLWRDSNMILMITGAPVPVGYLALLYANFSWIGIVFGMALWGSYQRGMYEWLKANQQDRSVVVMYACMVVYFGPTMLQLSNTLGFVFPIWAALRFVRRKPKALKKAPLALPGGNPSGASGSADSSDSSDSSEPAPAAAATETPASA